MSGSGAQRLGPVARKLLSPDAWTDGYPGPAACIKELDVLLKFAAEKRCLPRFVPMLEAGNNQRDEALNELRLAYLLENLGFPVIQWDPPGSRGKVGEFLLNSPEHTPIFTEIKSPGWESELSPVEIKAGRAKQPKYIGRGGGPVGNWKAVHRCISSPKTYPKFSSGQANLLIISDDLRLPLHDSLFQVEGALYGERASVWGEGYFTNDHFENLGGLAVFNAFSNVRGLEYEFVAFQNPHALPSTKLPSSMLAYKEKFTCIVRGTEPRT